MYAESRLTHNWLVKKALNERVGLRLAALDGLVIDLGCGARPFEKEILDHASNYIGVDWGNTLHGLHADVIADLNEPLPFPDEHASHIVSFEVMEHLREPQVMLREAYRILKPGGGVTLSTPFQWWLHEAPWDYYRYTRYGLQYLLEKSGFIDIEVRPVTGFWATWILKLNYQSCRLIRGSRLQRRVTRALLIPFWWCNQHAARTLDRVWPDERETAGYFTTARKP